MLTGLRNGALLTLLCACLYVPGLFALPPLDRDEARFAQASKQMLETGDVIDIRFQDSPRHKKPAGAYWAQAAAVEIAGAGLTAIWAYRLPSALAAWASVLFAYAAGARLFGPRTGLLGAALLAGSLLLTLEAHQAKTDALLLATVCAAQWALASLYARVWVDDGPERRPGRGPAWVFWIALGLSILIKGPIGPMIAGLTIAFLTIGDRDARWLRGLWSPWAFALGLVIAASWYVAILIVSGTGFIDSGLVRDLLGKVATAQESHGAPPGVHLAATIAFLWPASLFAWPALVRTWRDLSTDGVRFCLAWLVPSWIVFEAVSTKLPHYVLPLYPALALIVARAVIAAAEGEPGGVAWKPWRVLYVLWMALGLVVGAGAVALPMEFGGGFEPILLAPAAAAYVAAVAPVWLAWRGRFVGAAWTGIVAGALTLALVLQIAIPRIDGLWLARDIAAAVDEVAPGRTRPVAVAGYHEPSIVFLLGTETILTGGAGAANHVLSDPHALAVVDDREEEAFRGALGGGVEVEALAAVDGINYSRGRPTRLVLYRAAR